MFTVYLPLDQKGEDGKFYKKFEVMEGLPLGNDIVYQGPGENLLFPRYDRIKGEWVEDKDSIIEKMKEDLENIGNSNPNESAKINELDQRMMLAENVMLMMLDEKFAKEEGEK